MAKNTDSSRPLKQKASPIMRLQKKPKIAKLKTTNGEASSPRDNCLNSMIKQSLLKIMAAEAGDCGGT